MKSVTFKTAATSSIKNHVMNYLALTKPGITFLVLASMGVGFFLGTEGTISIPLLLHAAAGTLLIAGGAAAHNQYIERNLDKKMVRTVNRPLPAKKIEPLYALVFSLSLMSAGFLYLLLLVNPLTGLISGLTSLLYLAFYTPLKRISFINVMVGAVPGALPPVGGWAAVTGNIADPVPWILFGIVFLWQVPHVVAIAWLCNDDYRKAGFRMLPETDVKGYFSATTILGCLILLMPVSFLLYFLEINGVVYLAGAAAGGLLFLFTGLRFQMDRSKDNARKVLYGSLIYLPVVWFFIVTDLFVAWLTRI